MKLINQETFWKRLSYVIGLIPIGLIFYLIMFRANIEIRGFDIWLHLASGKFMTIHKMIPNFDFLSCTMQGAPWNNHEWLFQILVYNIQKVFGMDALLKMQAVLVLITMLVLFLIGYSKERQMSTIFMLFIVSMVYLQRFTLRPELFSLLFFALYIFVLAFHINKRWSTYVLMGVQLFWVNMHGFFFFGPLFAFIGLLSEWMKRHVPLPYEWNEVGRLTDDEYARLKKILFFVVLVCFVNPSGIKGAIYPLTVFLSFSGENKVFFNVITELKKPISFQTITDTSQYFYYKMLIFLSFLTFVFDRKRIDISALFLWVVFLVFSLNAVRNIAFFAFAAYLACITNLYSFSFEDIVPLRFTEEKFKHITLFMFKLFFIFWLLSFMGRNLTKTSYDFETYKEKSNVGGLSLSQYPHKAADFLIDNNIQGNFFNNFNAGAYLLGRCYPNIKVFIDGRTEVYGGQYFKNYQKIIEKGDMHLFDAYVDKFNLSGVILSGTLDAVPEDLAKHLYKSDQWELVYFDDDAVIFLKNIKKNQRWIKQYRLDLSHLEPKKYDIFKIGVRNLIPYPNGHRSFTLLGLEAYDLAIEEANLALIINPNYSLPYVVKGKAYACKKDFLLAYENFRIAAIFNPNDKKNRYNLALACYDLEKYDMALKEYQNILRRWPEEKRVFFLLARTFIKKQQFDKAMKALEYVQPFQKEVIGDLMLIADQLCENHQYDKAKALYEQSIALDPDFIQGYLGLAKVHHLIGQEQKSLEFLERALSIDKENEEAQTLMKELKSK